MKQHIILKTISVIIIPFIFLFGFYVLFHGEVSPGGGFPGGAICATALVLHSLIFSIEKTKKIISPRRLKFIGCFGALIFALLGFIPMVLGGRFLDYNMLAESAHLGQKIGIMGIEIGVQLTVFAVLSLIFLRIASQED